MATCRVCRCGGIVRYSCRRSIRLYANVPVFGGWLGHKITTPNYALQHCRVIAAGKWRPHRCSNIACCGIKPRNERQIPNTSLRRTAITIKPQTGSTVTPSFARMVTLGSPMPPTRPVGAACARSLSAATWSVPLSIALMNTHWWKMLTPPCAGPPGAPKPFAARRVRGNEKTSQAFDDITQ